MEINKVKYLLISKEKKKKCDLYYKYIPTLNVANIQKIKRIKFIFRDIYIFTQERNICKEKTRTKNGYISHKSNVIKHFPTKCYNENKIQKEKKNKEKKINKM